jgi:hypothetical protein
MGIFSPVSGWGRQWRLAIYRCIGNAKSAVKKKIDNALESLVIK